MTPFQLRLSNYNYGLALISCSYFALLKHPMVSVHLRMEQHKSEKCHRL